MKQGTWLRFSCNSLVLDGLDPRDPVAIEAIGRANGIHATCEEVQVHCVYTVGTFSELLVVPLLRSLGSVSMWHTVRRRLVGKRVGDTLLKSNLMRAVRDGLQETVVSGGFEAGEETEDEPHSINQALKARVKRHYECSDFSSLLSEMAPWLT
jgi:hypothetical protein